MYAPNHTDNEEIRKKVIIYKQEVEMYLSGKALALQAQSNVPSLAQKQNKMKQMKNSVTTTDISKNVFAKKSKGK